MIDLRFEHVSKRYWIHRESEEDAARSPLSRKLRRLWGRREEFWALRDASFEVEHGEALGIIGLNGAGKSTTLKLLFNITAPTRGKITVRGRLAALLEVASGFHPELTGRENVYLNGSLLGMKRSEITRKLDSIVEFAGVKPFIDTPVKRYSSGMYLRLGFSVAAHLDPDVLLLDEILTVGDAPFQSKCIERIGHLKRVGTTIVFVSHNLSAVESLCDRVLLLHHGQIANSGPPREMINAYEDLLLALPASEPSALTQVADSPSAKIISIKFFNASGRQTTIFTSGESLRAEVEFTASEPVKDVVIEVYFYSVWGFLHTHFSTVGGGVIDLLPGRGIVEFLCSEITLEVAAFNVEVSIKARNSAFTEHIDYKHCAIINVGIGKPVHGHFHTPHTWRLKRWNEEARDREDDVMITDIV